MNIKDFNDTLRTQNLSIVCAESITAGLLASTIASVSGASDVLLGSIVTYNRRLKTSILGVDPRVIDKETAESKETTTEMAYGLTKVYPCASIFVAVTGVASKPTNNYPVNKEVGQVYVSIYYNNKMTEIETIIKVKDDDRNKIREQTVEFILQNILAVINLNDKKNQ